MFADYRVPQVLVHFGAMEYDEVLLNLLKEGTSPRPSPGVVNRDQP